MILQSLDEPRLRLAAAPHDPHSPRSAARRHQAQRFDHTAGVHQPALALLVTLLDSLGIKFGSRPSLNFLIYRHLLRGVAFAALGPQKELISIHAGNGQRSRTQAAQEAVSMSNAAVRSVPGVPKFAMNRGRHRLPTVAIT